MGKIADISGLATETGLTTVENKLPDLSYLVKKTNYNTKVTEIENLITLINLIIIIMTNILMLQILIN